MKKSKRKRKNRIPRIHGSKRTAVVSHSMASKVVECSTPGCHHTLTIAHDADGGICWRCTYAMCPFEQTLPKAVRKEKNDGPKKPRGWAFMKEYVHVDGTVYHRGVEQPDLKGTLPPTKVKPKEKKKKSKWAKREERHQLMVEYKKLKDELQKLQSQPRTKGKVKKLSRKIKKLESKINKF